VAPATELICARHGVSTRISCVECDTPICPDCAVRTAVGLKCPDHAGTTRSMAATRASRIGGVGLLLIVMALVGVFQLVRQRGTAAPDTPPCPTETAPDVGIGPQPRSGHWRELAGSGLCGRYDAAVAWTGRELLIWGGENCAGAACPSDRSPHLGDGSAYTPATDKWRRLSAAPVGPREPAATAWTGSEMLVWGGATGDAEAADGAAYAPAGDKWRRLAASPLSARSAAASAWTGRELLVWGGGDAADGAAYDPAADRWRPMAAGPLGGRSAPVSAWTGRELLVWGGVSLRDSRELADGAAYDPAADRWRPLAQAPIGGRYTPASAWTGRELVVWGGNGEGRFPFDDGAAYDPSADRWRPLPDAPVAARTAAGAVWSGREMLVWGGVGSPGAGGDGGPLDQVLQPRTLLAPLGDGAAYDPTTDRWRALEPVPLLGRGFPIAAWDGQGMIVWGGLVAVGSPASASDGVRYSP
jgi:N-acetylneuraminic acid mutarotase